MVWIRELRRGFATDLGVLGEPRAVDLEGRFLELPVEEPVAQFLDVFV